MTRLSSGSKAEPTNPDAWPREKLLAVLAVGLIVGILLVASTAIWVINALRPEPIAAAHMAGSDDAVQDQRRDALAAAPMAQVDRDAAFGGAPAWSAASAILIPEPEVLRGPAGVPTGFPQTPEGAVGQLAAIDQAVLQAMSLQATADVHAAWSLAGAPPVQDWVLAGHVRSFLETAKQGTTKDVTTLVEVNPVGAQVKGTDGDDWVLACVLYDVRATIRTTSRIGFGRCERLQWADGRWQIAPGTQPAPAPSTWPGSQETKDAGWLTWTLTS